ncbi:unnamed protein product [Adineta ricciae]|uniref:Uncharacterized protein n=1 Tax=Adineta ricciae TaxID=249248 RepID=A0A814SPY8_ADIRI|nr:unnamed protein product [Adineta ricciae]
MAELRLEIPDDHDYPAADYMIIWLDDHIGQRGQYELMKKAFSSNIDSRHQTTTDLTDEDYTFLIGAQNPTCIKFAEIPMLLLAFDNLVTCYDAFERNKDRHIYFITSGTLGKHIIPRLIENHAHLFKDPITQEPYSSIYIFCGNSAYHMDWLMDYVEHLQIFNHEKDLLARLTRDVAMNFIQQSEYFLKKALGRYKQSKKVLNRYLQMDRPCKKDLEHVERRIAAIEKMINPKTADASAQTDDIFDNTTNDNEEVEYLRLSEACN